MNVSTHRQRITDYLEHGKDYGIQQIADAMGISHTVASINLKEMQTDGIVIGEMKGNFKIYTKPLRALAMPWSSANNGARIGQHRGER